MRIGWFLMGLYGCGAAAGEPSSETQPARSASAPDAAPVLQTAAPTTASAPEPAPGPPSHVVSVVADELRGCAIFDNGMMQCWGGFNFDGELGLGNSKEAEAPGWVQGIHGVTKVALSTHATCAIHTDGRLSCWGRKIGSSTMDNDDVLTPKRVAGVGKWRDVAISERHACAIDEPGALHCWGESQDGQLGIGDEKLGVVRRAPQRVDGISDVRGVLALPRGTAAWTSAGQLFIWGRLGGPESVPSGTAPRLVAGLADVTRAWASGQQLCALRRDAEVRCFGDETLSAFEAGKQLDVSASLGPLLAAGQKRAIAKGKRPKSIGPLIAPDGRGVSGVIDVAVFNHDASALTKDGSVYSWGSAKHGTVGKPTNSAGFYPPTRIQGIDGAVALTGSFRHRCALDGSGAVRCFGNGGAGRLGTDSNKKESLAAVVVPGLPKVIAVAANSYCTFAIGEDHSLWAWGSSWVHACGLPGEEPTKAPTRVPLQPTSSAPLAQSSPSQ